MSDPEVRFAAEFGRSVNRWDWWNLRNEHTPFQWALQRTLYRIAPYGEQRSDMRAAMMTANLMAMQASEKIPEEQFSEMVKSLSSYLRDESDYEDQDDLEAARMIARKDE